MTQDIPLSGAACAALAAGGGAAIGLWTGLAASGLGAGALVVCSACLIVGAGWLAQGIGGMPRRAALAAAGALGAGWVLVMGLTGREGEALLCLGLLGAAVLAARPTKAVATR